MSDAAPWFAARARLAGLMLLPKGKPALGMSPKIGRMTTLQPSVKALRMQACVCNSLPNGHKNTGRLVPGQGTSSSRLPPTRVLKTSSQSISPMTSIEELLPGTICPFVQQVPAPPACRLSRHLPSFGTTKHFDHKYTHRLQGTRLPVWVDVTRLSLPTSTLMTESAASMWMTWRPHMLGFLQASPSQAEPGSEKHPNAALSVLSLAPLCRSMSRPTSTLREGVSPRLCLNTRLERALCTLALMGQSRTVNLETGACGYGNIKMKRWVFQTGYAGILMAPSG